MAKPRRKQACTPELLANLRFRYEETAESIVDIARSIARSHTYLRALAQEHGWVKFAPPPLDLTPAARLAAEAAKLAEETGRLVLSSRATECNEGDPGPLRRSDHEMPGRMGPRLRGDDKDASATPPPPTPDSSPPPGDGAPDADLANLVPDARLRRLNEAARILDLQLALLRQKQALPQQGEDMKQINAEVKSLAATAALIEHQLRDLAHGRSTPMPENDHDDIPEDIDAFRLRLAAKIEAFLERRPDIGDGDEDGGAGHDPAGW
jgi:hypothetical protein